MKHAVQVNTYGGHAAACAAGMANVKIMERENLPEKSAAVGAYMLGRLRDLQERTPYIGDLRAKGLFIGVELVKEKATKEPIGPGVTNGIVAACQERGVIFGKSSLVYRGYGNVLYVCPPLVLTEAEADRMVAVLEEVLSQL
jgi:4-aminobutyrate aminotransferase-like enzyme